MQKRASDPSALAAPRPSGLRTQIIRAATHPLVLSGVAVGLVLIAIVTDAAARAGSVSFLVLCYLHARRTREEST